jgi:hypothetical protein
MNLIEITCAVGVLAFLCALLLNWIVADPRQPK